MAKLNGGRQEFNADRASRNRGGLDSREADRDSATPTEVGHTDFVNVENARAEPFPHEFPEGAYGAPAGEAAGDTEFAQELAPGGPSNSADGAQRGTESDGASGTESDGAIGTESDGASGMDGADVVEGDFDPRVIFFFDGG